MPNWPAARVGDLVIGVDVHAVLGFPIHPYIGFIFLWHTPTFPMNNVFINARPACTVGAMGYSLHIPQGAPLPITPTNMPTWMSRWFTNIQMGIVLMFLTIFANAAIGAIAALIPRRSPEVTSFIQDVTGINMTNEITICDSVMKSFGALTKWSTWVKLLIPPIPWPGAQGAAAIGSPNVTVNGGPLAFCAPLTGTSCSDIPIIPNAMVLSFSNVLVGVSFSQLIRAAAVNMTQAGIQLGLGKLAGKMHCGCR